MSHGIKVGSVVWFRAQPDARMTVVEVSPSNDGTSKTIAVAHVLADGSGVVEHGNLPVECFDVEAEASDPKSEDPRVIALARQLTEQMAALVLQKRRLREYEAARELTIKNILATGVELASDDMPSNEATLVLAHAYKTMQREANEQLAAMSKRLKDAGLT